MVCFNCTWTRGNASQEATLAELLGKGNGNLGLLAALVDFLLRVGGAWATDGLLLLLGQFGVLLAAKGLGVVGLVPLAEGGRVNGDDGALLISFISCVFK